MTSTNAGVEAEMEIYVDGGSAGDALVGSEVWRRSVSTCGIDGVEDADDLDDAAASGGRERLGLISWLSTPFEFREKIEGA